MNINMLTISMKAEADLKDWQFKLVKITGDRQVNKADGSEGEMLLGVLKNKPDADEQAEVQVMGVTQIEAGASVTAGNKVRSDGDGVIQPCAAAKDHAVGMALAGGGSGEQVPVLLSTATERGDYS